MKHVHLDTVPWLEWASTTGKFHGAGRQISEALGAVVNATPAAGGHPFDLEYGRLLPGKAGCPFHSHSAQWECYYIISGSGVMRHGDQRRAMRAGDVALHPPGSSHQLLNTGPTELLYYLVADNPLTEFCYYPDSDKWGHKPGGAIFRRQDAHYDLGEDDAPETRQPPAPPPPLPETPARFVQVDDLPWEHRHSPKGRYDSQCRDLSLALGGVRHTGVQGGGHPFDLQFRRVAPGTAICPYHSHSLQWELFVFTAGRGSVRTPDGLRAVGPGDIVLHPPGQPHQTLAAADSELECLIIADNPPEDLFRYPDSNKWGVRTHGKYFRLTETDYFDGEE
ncbi:MAG: cupin domain-containing protein [Opitutaceae bacterium]|nr:cupin domain-containing protein [Opitutaceae bacterium]MBP9914003.1 cupin domain-containing protein [Opitutaceae bacterium]